MREFDSNADFLTLPEVKRDPASSDEQVRILFRRITRLNTIRHRCSELLNTQGMDLLNRALFATYCDCRDLGLAQEAMQLIRR
ncbi:MAG: hypothetical protein HYX97_00225 [Chloroflexi bacterium]|nr:hypothetical protein [Chloroflexota bacterium]